MKRIKLLVIIIIAVFKLDSIAQQNDTIKIGSQLWMQKNLTVSTFKNGDPIPQAKSRAEWQKASKEKKASWCYYEFEEKNADKYGKFYNYYAVVDERGLAPDGWHIPNNNEWNLLKEEVGQEAGKNLKAEKGWKGGKNPNTRGFSALGLGIIDYMGSTHYEKTHAYFWSSSPVTPKNEPWHFTIYGESDKAVVYRECDLGCGLSVRCLKNK